MHIVYISDAKAGHRSQALGLYHAIERQSAQQVSFEEISIADIPLLSLLVALMTRKSSYLKQAPDWIISVGSHTQLRALLLARLYRNAKTVVLMKPNYPYTCFDYAVIPAHDGVEANDRILITQGALNPIVNQHRHQPNRILIALGGSSKRHAWHAAKVYAAIEQIVLQNPDAEIVLTTSRRTPNEFLAQLKQQNFAYQLQVFPVEDTPQGWIFEQMQLAEAVWVTEDSVSMIYEALTAGCRVGVIEIDRIKQDRITASVEQLRQARMLSTAMGVKALAAPINLQEADRIAKLMIESSRI